MRELWQLGALELAAMIRDGSTTSRAVMGAHLASVDAVNPHLNAVVRRLDDEALAAADGADRAVDAGSPLIGDKYTDLRCLAIAAQIEHTAGVATPIDPVLA